MNTGRKSADDLAKIVLAYDRSLFARDEVRKIWPGLVKLPGESVELRFFDDNEQPGAPIRDSEAVYTALSTDDERGAKFRMSTSAGRRGAMEFGTATRSVWGSLNASEDLMTRLDGSNRWRNRLTIELDRTLFRDDADLITCDLFTSLCQTTDPVIGYCSTDAEQYAKFIIDNDEGVRARPVDETRGPVAFVALTYLGRRFSQYSPSVVEGDDVPRVDPLDGGLLVALGAMDDWQRPEYQRRAATAANCLPLGAI